METTRGNRGDSARCQSFRWRHLEDAQFIGGVALYRGEGSKTQNSLDLSNADPAALRPFIRWVRRYLDADAEFVLSMHLHEGNNESAAKKYWASAVGMPDIGCTKTFIKPPGTGHRKNHPSTESAGCVYVELPIIGTEPWSGSKSWQSSLVR